jgi:hypothetical protein
LLALWGSAAAAAAVAVVTISTSRLLCLRWLLLLLLLLFVCPTRHKGMPSQSGKAPFPSNVQQAKQEALAHPWGMDAGRGRGGGRGGRCTEGTPIDKTEVLHAHPGCGFVLKDGEAEEEEI